ncbi:tetraacyldisaccharide 4'-kinase [Pelagibacterales bacterium SAG-MED01]|nr:tetraacyldisaccharide 4'-kinase [Pelagibacterales bacterium SAG-MED01]
MKLKKPKFWDYNKPSLISYLLLPFTIPLIINNFLLSLKKKKNIKNVKTICVGNINVGGTGKTPTTIKLYQLIKKLNLEVFTAKKFYSSQIDETIILKKKTKLLVAKSRKEILDIVSDNIKKILVYDDGLQDKDVSYDLEFVCFDSDNWIGNGYLMPSGPLREKLKSLKKYDGVFLKGDNSNNPNIIEQIKKYNNKIQIFMTHYEPINLKKFNLSEKYLIFSGIGNSNSFKNILIKNNFKIVEEIIYPDHYNYTESDIEKIKMQADKLDANIITTEKDHVKISETNQMKIKFLEIELKIKDETNLINFLKSKIYE